MAIPLKNLLYQSLQRAGIAEQVRAAMTCDVFNEIVYQLLGPQAKGKVRGLYVKNGTLTVSVSSSSLGQEIKLHEFDILEKLAKNREIVEVSRLRFLV